MTALHDAIEYSALGWVKPELDETLRLAQVEIEGFVEDPADAGRMRVCADLLHQVQGTLRMVELYAPAMVAEEMESLAGALAQGEVADRDGACSALLKGVVQLPDYLERLQSGHREISIVLMPILNELRAARGEAGLSESVLFNPDLDRALPASVPRGAEQSAGSRAAEAAPALARLRDAMQGWPEQGEPADAESLRASLEALLPCASEDPQRRMLWVAASVAEALRDRALPAGTNLRQAFASAEREARHLFEQGVFEAPRPDAVLEPTRQLLYFASQGGRDHAALAKLREVFDLDALQASEEEIDHARGSVAGRNRALLDTVAAAVKEDLLRVKDALDLYLRTGQDDPASLQPQSESLQRVADTLGMLGLGLARNLVQQQRDAMQEIVEGKRAADLSALLEVAGALLYVDASLDDQVARLAAGTSTDSEEDLTAAEARKVMDVLLREAITNFANARQAFVAFVETGWNHDELAGVPKLLLDVSGALRILELPQAAEYLDGVRLYTEAELIRRRRVPNSRQIDTFADALESVEYYLEAVREHRARRDDILDITRASLESLGYWPLPAGGEAAAPEPAIELAPVASEAEKAAAEVPVAEELPAFDATPAAEAPAAPAEARPADASAALAAAATTWAPVGIVPPIVPPAPPAPEPTPAPVAEPMPEPALQAEPEPVAEAPAPVAAPAPAAALGPLFAGFDATNNDIDDEIREIFLEEFEEEIGNLSQLIPPWKADPNNLDLLQPVRRVFHTLKGSGRLVGAKVLGEFSWKIEGMLNRVRDGQRMASPAVVAMVEHAYAALPELHAALAGAEFVTADLPAMEAAAERIAAGDDTMPSFTPRTAAPAAEVEAPVEEAVDVAPVAAVVEAVEVEAEVAETVVEDGIPVSVDPVLFDILQAEVGSHLGTIEAWLARAGRGPASVDETVLRAIHTMNGAFAMSEVPAITDALTPAEGYVRRLLASGRMVEGDAIDAITELAARVRATVTALARPGASVPRCDALAARFAALRDGLPEPQLVSFADEAVDLDTAHVVEDVSLDAIDLTEFSELAEAVPTAAEEAPVAEGLDTLVNEETERELAKLFGISQPGDLAAELAEASRLADEQAAAAQAAFAAEVEASPMGELPAAASPVEAHDAPADVAADAVEAPEAVEAAEADDALVSAELTEAELAEFGAFAPALPATTEPVEAAIEADTATDALELEAMDLDAAAPAGTGEDAIEAVELEAVPDLAEASDADVQAAEDEFAALEAELLAAERAAFEAEEGARIEADALAEADAGQISAEQAEAERLAAEQAEAERLAAEQAEAERLAAEHADTTRLGAEAIALATAGSLADADEEPVEATTSSAAFVAPSDEADPDAALDMDELDAELVEIFVDEGRDLLDHSDQLLVRLRESLHDRETIIGLQRDLHTLKGGARMAGIMAVGELGHAMESLLEAVAEQRQQLKREDVPLLEHGFDKLHRMVTRVGEGRAIAMPTHLIELFDARALGRSVEPTAAPAATPQATPAPAQPVAAPEPVRAEPTRAEPSVDVSRLSPVAPTLAALSAPMDFTAGGDDDGIRGAQEQVRVRAELLDRLVNYAGEVAIYRSRLEQQLGAFRAATAEMEQTNLRLRDQLRRLEIETEAQIIARYQREGEVRDDNFDPLELDRFSTVQQLSRALAETATDLTSLQSTLDDLTQQYDTLLLQQSRVSSELQEGLMRTRMVPFDTVVPRLRRVLRQAGNDTGKPVQLKLDGAQGELDRNVLERMTAPLEHMLRNAVAHGLEKPEKRKAAGKSEEGSVRIAVRKEGSEVVLAVSDDGGGLDRAAIRARAEARGLVRKDAVLSNAQLDAMIFEPGFSTAEEVTRLAGRGVGMDVVASEVRQLGGTIDIHSEPGKGTTFTLRLPQTLAVTQAAFVRIGEVTFAVPIASVRGVGRIQREALARGETTYRYGNEEYVLHDLGKLIGHAPAKAEGQLQMPLLLTRSGDLHVAVTVDQIIGNREIVVKPIGPQVASIPGIFGATIMGDGSVVVILDVAPLVRRKAQQEDELPQAPVEQRSVPLVMVVDDSITMRKVTGRVLERNNLEVITAKDGLDALERMADRVPDLMLLDIEMPRMDGYELATAMKAEPRLANVPIIMITSRTGDKHRQRALDIGVNRYLGKPYQENELMKNVFSLLEAVRSDA